MKLKTTDTYAELEEFVIQQASDDALLSPSEKHHQTEVVKGVLSDQVSDPKTLKKLLDEYIAKRSLPRVAALK